MQSMNSIPMTPWQMWMTLSQRIHQLHCQLDEQQTVINRLMKQMDGLAERVKAGVQTAVSYRQPGRYILTN